MKLSRFRSYAVSSLGIGVVIVCTMILAAWAYTTPSIIRVLTGHGIWVALLAAFLCLVYIVVITAASVVGVVLSILSLVRREGRRAIAVGGLVVNAVVLLLGGLFFGTFILNQF